MHRSTDMWGRGASKGEKERKVKEGSGRKRSSFGGKQVRPRKPATPPPPPSLPIIRRRRKRRRRKKPFFPFPFDGRSRKVEFFFSSSVTGESALGLGMRRQGGKLEPPRHYPFLLVTLSSHGGREGGSGLNLDRSAVRQKVGSSGAGPGASGWVGGSRLALHALQV